VINLRYHIVSIVAVFLALGIGIAMGTAFIDGVIVDRLEQRVQNLDDERQADEGNIADLQQQLDDTEAAQVAFEEEALPSLSAGRLDGVPVTVLADRGIDPDAVDALRDMLTDSEARFAGVLWLGQELDYGDDEQRALLADAIGLVTDDHDRVRAAVRSGLRRAFVLSPSGASPTIDMVIRLTDAGIIDVDYTGVAALDRSLASQPGQRYIVASGEDGSLVDSEFLVDLVADLGRTSPNPVVGVEVPAPDHADWPTFVDRYRGPDPDFSTVDDLPRFEGMLATLISADRLGQMAPGAFGFAPSATSVLPPP
jgi:Copper transport outer membrane protein, MctB